MDKITVHPGGFIKRNYIDELGLTATELADALEVSESTLSRLVHEKIDLSPALAVKLSKVAVDHSNPAMIHKVDALSGATLTARGVQHLVRFWLGEEGFGPYLEQRQAEGIEP